VPVGSAARAYRLARQARQVAVQEAEVAEAEAGAAGPVARRLRRSIDALTTELPIGRFCYCRRSGRNCSTIWKVQ